MSIDYMAMCPTQIFRRTGGKQHKGHDRCIKLRKQREAHDRQVDFKNRQKALAEDLAKQELAEKFSGEKDVVSTRKDRPRKRAKK